MRGVTYDQDRATSMSEREGESSGSRGPEHARGEFPADSRARHIETSIALAITLGLALFWTIPLSTARSWGWDESMHAELPAARMLVAVELGRIGEAARALLDCAQYPCVYPSCLAIAEAIFGLSERVARVLGTLVWCTTLFGLFLLGREIARGLVSEARDRARSSRFIPWTTMALGALSPLALAYSGTLFLEVPFTCAAVFALRAWLRRGHAPDARTSARREFAAGAWITVAFFAKFNYALMLGAGLAADWLADAVRSWRAGSLRAYLARARWLCGVPLLAGIWWFVLPIPGGLDIAREHREAFLDFLAGNRGLVTPFAHKPLYACSYFALNPRMTFLEAIALLATLRFLSSATIRCLWFCALLLWVPVWLHPFHQDRFWIPGGAALWPLFAIGVQSLLPASVIARTGVLISAAVFVALPIDDTMWLAERVGIAAADPALRSYQSQVFAGWHDLTGSRPLPTAGLLRVESEAFLDTIARETRPDERVAWLGMSNELSPAALHIGLLQRGGSPERFLRDVVQPLDVAFAAEDPHWSDERFDQFVRSFDVVLYTEPIDFKLRHGREFMRKYCARLTEGLAYDKRTLAEIPIAISNAPPRLVRLFACRKP
jgi:hypothetical protein